MERSRSFTRATSIGIRVLLKRKAHLDPDVLLAVLLVHKEIVHLADLLARVVVDLVALILLFEFPQTVVVSHVNSSSQRLLPPPETYPRPHRD
jgi:hypothetical protein